MTRLPSLIVIIVSNFERFIKNSHIFLILDSHVSDMSKTVQTGYFNGYTFDLQTVVSNFTNLECNFGDDSVVSFNITG